MLALCIICSILCWIMSDVLLILLVPILQGKLPFSTIVIWIILQLGIVYDTVVVWVLYNN